MTRRGIVSWLAGAGLLLLALIVVFSLREKPYPSGEATVELFPIRTESPITPEVESLFAAVDPEQDRWVGEVVTERLEERSHTLADAIRNRRPEEIAPLLHSGFRATPLEPSATDSLSAPLGVELFRGRHDQELSLSVAEFPRALLDWTAEFGSFEELKFKIVAVEVEQGRKDDPAGVTTQVIYLMAGQGREGQVLTRRGTWQMEWTRTDQQWKMKGLRVRESSRGESATPFFTDVSTLALGEAPSYWKQMRLGLNHFRASIDAASGIGLYGHNGVAIGDIDGDGFEDLFVAQPAGLPNRLYRNRGDGTFVDISRGSGVDLLDRTSMGLFADYENDGDQDLFLIIQNRTPLLFVNDGQGKFEYSRRAQFQRRDGTRATLTSASLADYDNDGYLDLYVCSYRYFESEGEDTQLALPYPYHDATNGPSNVLFRNRGDGTFVDVTEVAGLNEGNNRYSFASSWGDFNGDGLLDLYVANDFGRNNLYQNLGKGRFREVSRQAGVEDIGAGMSVAWTDYDLDGRDDLYVGNMWSSAGLRLTGQPGYQAGGAHESYVRHAKGNSLFRNRGDGRFEDVSAQADVELGRWAWSSDFFDCDNDGDEDLYIANGFITNSSTKDL